MTTILDAVRNHGDSADVYDAEYDDGGIGWVVEDDMRNGDVYDRVIYRMAESIAVARDNGPYSVVACISAYVKENLDMWVEFGREFNNDRAQISDDEDEGMYWAVKTVQNLAAGMYPNDAYAWLAQRMGV